MYNGKHWKKENTSLERRVLAFAMCLALLLCWLPPMHVHVHAADTVIASGFCGYSDDYELMSWTVTQATEGGGYTLTFSVSEGEPDMADYTLDDSDGSTSAPWWAYRDGIQTVVVEEGVNSVGEYALYGLQATVYRFLGRDIYFYTGNDIQLPAGANGVQVVTWAGSSVVEWAESQNLNVRLVTYVGTWNGELFTDLAATLYAAEDGDTIVFLADYTDEESEDLPVNAESLTLDLQGHAVTLSGVLTGIQALTLTGGGTLTAGLEETDSGSHGALTLDGTSLNTSGLKWAGGDLSLSENSILTVSGKNMDTVILPGMLLLDGSGSQTVSIDGTSAIFLNHEATLYLAEGQDMEELRQYMEPDCEAQVAAQADGDAGGYAVSFTQGGSTSPDVVLSQQSGAGPVVRLGSTEYTSLSSAINDLTQGENRLTMLQDTTAWQTLTCNPGADISLDLNGCKATFFGLTTSGDITVTDSQGGGELIVRGELRYGDDAGDGENALRVDGAAVSVKDLYWSSKIITLENGGTMTVTDSAALGSSQEYGFILDIEEGSSLGLPGSVECLGVSAYVQDQIAAYVSDDVELNLENSYYLQFLTVDQNEEEVPTPVTLENDCAARVDTEGYHCHYANLSDALTAAAQYEDPVITVLKGVNDYIDGEDQPVRARNAVLDLNGQIVILEGTLTLENSFTIRDSAENKGRLETDLIRFHNSSLSAGTTETLTVDGALVNADSLEWTASDVILTNEASVEIVEGAHLNVKSQTGQLTIGEGSSLILSSSAQMTYVPESDQDNWSAVEELVTGYLGDGFTVSKGEETDGSVALVFQYEGAAASGVILSPGGGVGPEAVLNPGTANERTYALLEDAINDRESSDDVIGVLRDVNAGSLSISDSYTSIILELNGHAVTVGTIGLMASLTVRDSAQEKGSLTTGSLQNQNINGSSILTVDGASFTTGECSWMAKYVVLENGAVLTVNGDAFFGGGDEDGFNLTIEDTSLLIFTNLHNLSGYNPGRVASQIEPYLPAAYSVTGDGSCTIMLGDDPATQVTLGNYARASVTAVDNLVYNGTEQTLVSASEIPDGGSVTYSLEEQGTYAATAPVGKDAGTYTVYYKVTGSGYLSDSGSTEATIEPKTVSVTWGETELPYTGEVQVPGYTIDNLEDGDSVSLSITGEQSAVGTGYRAVVRALSGDSKDNYQLPSTHQIATDFSIVKGTPNPDIPEDLTATYGQTLADVTLPDGWTWDAPTTSVGNVGSHTFAATYTPDDTTNYDSVPANLTVTVGKATPEPQAPTNLTATYGQTLADVTLPGGWTWNAPGTSVGTVGSREFAATYTPDDTTNYNTVSANLTVTVGKAVPAYTVPTGLTATYGQTLADVTLPQGWTWDAPGTSVGSAGTNSFPATYTPTDTANYTTASADVPVTVGKAALSSLAVSLTGWTYGDTANTPTVTGNTGGGGVSYTYYDSENNALDARPENAGTYRVVAAVAETANYASGQAETTFTIARAELKASVNITGWTFGETANAPTVSGNTGGGAVTYTYAGADGVFSGAVPTAAGDYVVKAVIQATENFQGAEVTESFTIAKAALSSLAVSLTGWTYGETANTPSVTGNSGGGAVSYTYAERDGAFSATVPTAPGTYVVMATVAATDNYEGGEATAAFTIGKGAITPTVTMNGWTYGETASTPSVSGNTGGGDVSYTYYDSENNPLDARPQDAGTYRVVATVAETANYASGQAETTFTVARAAVSLTVTMNGWTFGDTANTPTVTGNTGGGDVSYTYYSGNEALDARPQDAGTYRVVATVAETANYASGEAETTFTIAKAALSSLAVSLTGWTYGDTPGDPRVSGNSGRGDVTYTYYSGNEALDARPENAGTYRVVATVAETANYASGEAETTFTIARASQSAPAAPTRESATISSVTLTAIPGGEYSMDGDTWQTSPTFTGLEMGTRYSFYQRLAEDDNHTASPASQGATLSTADHAHQWLFTANNNVLTATCANEDGGHTGDAAVTLTLIAPTLTVYGGQGSPEATVSGSVDGVDLPEIVYKRGNTVLGTAPTGAGTYTASITLENATATVGYTIAKAAITVSVTLEDWTYGDTAETPGVSGNDGNGTVSYAYSDEENGTYTGTAPTAAGTYWVMATVAETDNYQSGTAKTSFTIERAVPNPERPTGLTASYGQTLGDVTLPEGWAWDDDPETEVGEVGTSSFAATYTPDDTENYETVSDEFTVTVGKATPKPEIPEGLTATYGQTLATVELPQGWEWDTPDVSVGSAGTATFSATYTPDEIGNYNTVTTNLTVTVEKATPEPEIPEGLTAAYGDTLAKVELPTGWAWDDDLQTSVGGVGRNEFTATYTPDDTANYNTVSRSLVVSVGKATPDYTVPENLTAAYGQTLGEVTLPEGWSWDEDRETEVGDVGTHTFAAVFTPSDTTNYETVSQELTVTVGKAAPDYTVPSNLTATYGQTLADVTLPQGWAWDDPGTTSVGDAGIHRFSATYTPGDTTNHNTVTENLTITVGKADPNTTLEVNISGWTYGETPNDPTVSGNVGSGAVSYTYSNQPDGTYTEDVPQNAGEYWVKASVAETDNYLAGEAVKGFAIAKAMPDYSVSLSGWTYGETANAPTVTGNTGTGTVTYSYSTQADGDYTEEMPQDAGDYWVRAYVPETENYRAAESKTGFTISRANLELTVTITGWTYGETANAPTVTGNTGNGAVTFTYAADGDGTFTQDVPQNAGEYWVKASVAETENYRAAESLKAFTISRAEPEYSIPTGLTATYGDTLGDVQLPEVWAWDDDPETSVGNAGTARFTATFTPADLENYHPVTETLTISVGKALPAFTVSAGELHAETDASKVQLSRSDETAPGTLTLTETTTALTVGANECSWSFTPTDAVNYETVTGTVTVTVTDHEWEETWTYDYNEAAGTVGETHYHLCSVCLAHSDEAAHQWGDPTASDSGAGYVDYACDICQAVKTEACTHENSWSEWESLDETHHVRTCRLCGQEQTQEHIWDEGVATDQEGVLLHTCEICHETKTVECPGHQYGDWTASPTDPTLHQHQCSICGHVETAEHTPAGDYGYDGVNHWQLCSVCGAAVTEEHIFGDWEGNVSGCYRHCSVCNALETKEHDHPDTWESDGTSHWHVCSDCGEHIDVEEHVYDDTWQSDETGHWQECTICHAPTDKEEHDFTGDWLYDENGHWHACTVCGTAEDPESHDGETSPWQYNENEHWRICAECGGEFGREAHSFVNGEACVCGCVPGHVCTADMLEYCEEIPASCGSVGYKEHYRCTECGKSYWDAEATRLIENSGELEIPATGHTPGEEWLGDDTGHWQECTVCGERLNFREHTPGEEWLGDDTGHWHACTVCGEKLNFREHTPGEEWVTDEGAHWHECTVCGLALESGEHVSAGAATEEEPEVCEICGRILQPEVGHVHANHLTLIPGTEATCAAEGRIAYYECSCGAWFADATGSVEITDRDSVILPRLEHTPAVLEGREPTCTQPGLTEGSCCAVCGEILTAQEEIPALGHTPDEDWHVDENGHWHVCSVCGEAFEPEEHVSAGAATEEESEVCAVCGYVLTPPIGHVHENHLTAVAATEPTCTEPGNIAYYVCSCGVWFADATGSVEITDHDSVVLAPLGHTPGETWASDESGHWHECTVCGLALDSAAHVPGSPATTEHGQVCTVCGYELAPARPGPKVTSARVTFSGADGVSGHTYYNNSTNSGASYTVTMPSATRTGYTLAGWVDEAGRLHRVGEEVTLTFAEHPTAVFTAKWAQIMGLGEVYLEAGVPYTFGPSVYRVSGDDVPIYRHYRISGDDKTLYKGGAVFYVPVSGYYTISVAD